MTKYRIGVPMVFVRHFTLEANDIKHAREIAEQVYVEQLWSEGSLIDGAGEYSETYGVAMWEVEKE